MSSRPTFKKAVEPEQTLEFKCRHTKASKCLDDDSVKPKVSEVDLRKLYGLKPRPELITKEVIQKVKETGKLDLHDRHLLTVPEKIFTIDFSIEEEKKRVKCIYDERNIRRFTRWWSYKQFDVLDLSCNRLKSISDDIANLVALRDVNISGNYLKKLPSKIGSLQYLEYLNASDNRITELPESFYDLKNLRELDLKTNLIKVLKDNIENLKDLIKLNVQENKLSLLPRSLKTLINLDYFNCSHNKIVRIPSGFHMLKNLTMLDISYNKISNLPSFKAMPNLRFFNGSNNLIVFIPDFTYCHKLNEVKLDNNSIMELHAECFYDSTITLLSLKSNKLTTVPEDLVKLEALEFLDISDNSIKRIPPVISQLTALVKLNMGENPIENVPKNVVRQETHQIIKFLTNQLKQYLCGYCSNAEKDSSKLNPHVALDRKKLKDGSFLLPNLGLEKVPSIILDNAIRKNVHVIDLSHNILHNIPQRISQLRKDLTELNLNDNVIKELPAFIGSFENLVTLDLSFNFIHKLPDEFKDLLHLKNLNLSHNRLIEIPSYIYKLQRVQTFNLSNNLISEINGVGATNMISLYHLDLSNNKIRNLPAELGLAIQIKELNVQGNPLVQPRERIIRRGTAAIMAYLRRMVPEEDPTYVHNIRPSNKIKPDFSNSKFYKFK